MTVDETLLAFTLAKLDEAFALVGGLDDDEANARPDLPGANSAYALGTHLLGMARRWSSTVSRGVPVPRDREAEFTATGRVADLLAEAATVRAAFAEDVRAVDGDAAPVAPPEREDSPWLASNHGVQLHVFEEVCQHLGHLELTRDLVRAARGDVSPAP